MSKTDIGADRFEGKGDNFYAMLLKTHEELSFEQSAELNARLVLILANLVADLPALTAALEKARVKAS